MPSVRAGACLCFRGVYARFSFQDFYFFENPTFILKLFLENSGKVVTTSFGIVACGQSSPKLASEVVVYPGYFQDISRIFPESATLRIVACGQSSRRRAGSRTISKNKTPRFALLRAGKVRVPRALAHNLRK